MAEPDWSEINWGSPSEAAEAMFLETKEQLLEFLATGLGRPRTSQLTTQKPRANEAFEGMRADENA